MIRLTLPTTSVQASSATSGFREPESRSTHAPPRVSVQSVVFGVARVELGGQASGETALMMARAVLAASVIPAATVPMEKVDSTIHQDRVSFVTTFQKINQENQNTYARQLLREVGDDL